jgi:predicted DNA-binding transcriptional regulator YafY
VHDDRDDPTGRAIALLSCFTSRAHWTGAELATRLGVTTRTLRRDVERLRGLGYDIDATTGTTGGYRLRAAPASHRCSSTPTRRWPS